MTAIVFQTNPRGQASHRDGARSRLRHGFFRSVQRARSGWECLLVGAMPPTWRHITSYK